MDLELAQRLVLRKVVAIPYLEREYQRHELSPRGDGPRGRFIPTRMELPRDHGRSPLLVPRQLEDHIRVARVGHVDGFEAVGALEFHHEKTSLLQPANVIKALGRAPLELLSELWHEWMLLLPRLLQLQLEELLLLFLLR
jgi:hypothetical protein